MDSLGQMAQSNFHSAAQFVGSVPTPYLKKAAIYLGVPGSILSATSLGREMSSSQRGEIIPIATGIGTGITVAPAVKGMMAMGISALATSLGVTVPGIGALAWLASIYPDAMIGAGARNTIRTVTSVGRQIRHLEFGGHYTDTETAGRLRMQSAYEMSGATSAARRYLGQEAYFLHR